MERIESRAESPHRDNLTRPERELLKICNGVQTTTYLETTVGLNIEGLITLVDCFNRVDIMFGVVLGAVWFEKLKA